LNTSSRRILVSARIFAPSARLVARLRQLRAERGADEITETYDAFMLDPGLGPPTYLSSDGRIVWDDDMWGVVGTRADAFSAIQAGVAKTGVLELLELLPGRAPSAVDCDDCSATGRFDAHGNLKDVHGKAFAVVCPKCAGLGWIAPSMGLTDSVLEAG
jgi:hypothetical protein